MEVVLFNTCADNSCEHVSAVRVEVHKLNSFELRWDQVIFWLPGVLLRLWKHLIFQNHTFIKLFLRWIKSSLRAISLLLQLILEFGQTASQIDTFASNHAFWSLIEFTRSSLLGHLFIDDQVFQMFSICFLFGGSHRAPLNLVLRWHNHLICKLNLIVCVAHVAARDLSETFDHLYSFQFADALRVWLSFVNEMQLFPKARAARLRLSTLFQHF